MINLKKLFVVLTCGTGMLMNIQAQADVWVGADINCDYSTIQAAIDFIETGADTNIMIANNVPNGTYFENLNLATAGVNANATLTGGYDQCQGVNTAVPVIIDGSNSAPVFSIIGDGVAKVISLKNLEISNGLYDAVDELAGGLNIVGDMLTVDMVGVNISQNTGYLGGGLYAQGAGQNIFLSQTKIINNTARNGGGLACKNAYISVRNLSALSLNSADSVLAGEGNGGGAFLNSGCFLNLGSGSIQVAGISGVVGNQASNHGGGIYIDTAGRLYAEKNFLGEQPAIMDNVADADADGTGNGGGIYATGNNTKVNLHHGKLANNEAVNGGGIAVNDQAQVSTFTNASNCFKYQPCIVFQGNKAGKNFNVPSGGNGGAFYASNAGTIQITHSEVKNNMADNGLVAVVNTGGKIELFTDFLTDNGDLNDTNFNHDNLFQSIDFPSEITLFNVTIAGNDISASSNHVFLVSLGGRLFNNHGIIQDDSADVLETVNNSGTQSYISMDCVVLHEIQTVNGIDIATSIVDSTAVDFVDPNSGDYHIQPTSIAVDQCAFSGTIKDIDGEELGFDDPNSANVNGANDAGADETYTSDVIFKDGFN